MAKKRKLIWIGLSGEQRSMDIKMGIYEYMHSHELWDVLPSGPLEGTANILMKQKDEGLDGAIAGVGRRDLASAVPKVGIPFVNIYGGGQFRGLPQVGADDLAIGKLAAEHFVERGFANFAFCGMVGGGFVASRWMGFRNELRRRGLASERFFPHKVYRPVRIPGRKIPDYIKRIGSWVAQLPKPAGVFCVNDMWADRVIEACQGLGLEIPEEVAILGVNDERSVYPKSSIRLPGRQTGYEAARILDRLMQGKKPPVQPVLLPPECVMVRKSTDILAVDDPDVAAAIRFIREHACEGITVEDVMEEVLISRPTLYSKFRAVLGHSVFHEIRRVQLDRARKLLRDTDMSMEAVAQGAGFGGGVHLSLDFKKRTGQTPSAYRRQFRQV